MASPTNPDFLFGFHKGYTTVLVPKFPDSVTLPTVPDLLVKSTLVGSGDRHTGEPVMSQAQQAAAYSRRVGTGGDWEDEGDLGCFVFFFLIIFV
ncbi:hypothetical protein D8674_000308 [Pyrus ussuriensis x Pyrus communis]|uniref:Uncharacterized protein n=1 Tax=Pyrus ussuriensis x Pyrus communis TaxID=2448454 RepID=A0A5N5F2S1_9ROSA|nr:hypothetical protein D8674_000308 [Pyrus ussuriensis x Pyrus communis]